MEQVYYYIGFALFWLASTLGVMGIIGFLSKVIFNKIGDWYSTVWLIVDYARHQKKFKAWLDKRNKDIKESFEI